MSKLYRGIRDPKTHGVTVYVDETVLDINISREIKDHAPDFEISYFGAGPSQTALAILYDATGSEEISLQYHQDFKREFIATADYEGFVLLESQVKDWLSKQLKNTEESF